MALKQDATSSITGIIYQFYVALELCENLTTGERLFIEKYGDISISNSKQFEVKKYEDGLTDLHENIWKTINNWLDKKFTPSYYKDLVLFTTQNFSETSSFKEWNSKTVNAKKDILKAIQTRYKTKQKKSATTEKLVESVLHQSNSAKLLEILEKFKILDSSPIAIDYYNNLIDTKAGHLPSANRSDYINSLLGFIIAPETISNNWTITYNNFSERKQALSEQYSSITKIFPKINLDISESDLAKKSNHLFVKKIDDIKYDKKKNKAITDYIRAGLTINQELKKYSISKEHYDNYDTELLDFITPKFDKGVRNATEENHISKSQDFYDDIIGSNAQSFMNFNDTPIFFRNGMIHHLTDDDTKKLKWKLKEENDEQNS